MFLTVAPVGGKPATIVNLDHVVSIEPVSINFGLSGSAPPAFRECCDLRFLNGHGLTVDMAFSTLRSLIGCL